MYLCPNFRSCLTSFYLGKITLESRGPWIRNSPGHVDIQDWGQGVSQGLGKVSRSCWHTRLRSRCQSGPRSCQGSIRTGFNSKLPQWLLSAFHSPWVVALKAKVPCCRLIARHLQLLVTCASSQGISKHESLFPSNHIARRVRQSMS